MSSPMQSGDRTTTLVRVALLLGAVPDLVVGAWALFAPRSWYDDFPGFAHHWVSPYGAYNEHFVQDVGCAYLGFAVLLGIAAMRPTRSLVRGATIAALVFSVPHALIHVFVRESLSTADYVGVVISQVFAVGLALFALTQSRHLRDA